MSKNERKSVEIAHLVPSHLVPKFNSSEFKREFLTPIEEEEKIPLWERLSERKQSAFIYFVLICILAVGLATVITCSCLLGLGIPTRDHYTDPYKILGICIGAVIVLSVLALFILLCCENIKEYRSIRKSEKERDERYFESLRKQQEKRDNYIPMEPIIVATPKPTFVSPAFIPTPLPPPLLPPLQRRILPTAPISIAPFPRIASNNIIVEREPSYNELKI